MCELLPRRAKPEHRARRALRPCSVGLEPMSFSAADRPLFRERCAGAPSAWIDDPDAVRRECEEEKDLRGAPRGAVRIAVHRAGKRPERECGESREM